MADTRDRVFVHWLGNSYDPGLSDEEILRRVQRYHQNDQGWTDIGYSWAVGRSARAFEGRGLNIAGGHTEGENFDSYGIVFLIGEGEVPTQAMWQTFTELVEYIRQEDPKFGGNMDGRVYGHQHDDEASTECPGDVLADWAWEYRHSRDYEPRADVGLVQELSLILASAGYSVPPGGDREQAVVDTVSKLLRDYSGWKEKRVLISEALEQLVIMTR